jgi:hypothetical protein
MSIIMSSLESLGKFAISIALISALALSFCAAPESSNSGKESDSCNFEIKEVYFRETDDPSNPMLIVKGVIGPSGFHKYVMHFPPQVNTAQGIGPIEVGTDEPCKEERCRPLNPCQEFITQDFVARSYPDNVPEFGKSYYVELTFYLNDGSSSTWRGNVGWKS